MKVKGIHHISSIVGQAQKDVDFYSGVLGLRLVKKTLNYDDKNYYHLYYGNKNASSEIVTTFPMNNMPQGKIGDGQVGYVSLAIPKDSFGFWKKRLNEFNIKNNEYTRFDKNRLYFTDPDGLEIEFIESDLAADNPYSFNGVSEKQAYKGIINAALFSKLPKETLTVLTDVFGYEIVDEDNDFYQLKLKESDEQFIELLKNSRGIGQVAKGSVHHLAFKVKNEDIVAWRDYLVKKGYHPTDVKERHYFRSVYFREPGGILFELATAGPGFLIDETVDNLGENFIIPKKYIDETQAIIKKMPAIVQREIDEI
ncbi:MAG: ring-cleaving dioxygenase [Erysipelothrix sp.]|nr:ring-cleaving dioxygenase [Erysipelothrix sp.]